MSSPMMTRNLSTEYKFRWIEMGANGSTAVFAVFNSSELLEAVPGRLPGTFFASRMSPRPAEPGVGS